LLNICKFLITSLLGINLVKFYKVQTYYLRGEYQMLHQTKLIKSDSNAKNSELEYKRGGKFLNIKMLAADLVVANMSKKQKPLIKLQDPKFPNEYLICTGWDKIGMLADFLGIKRSELQDMVKSNIYTNVEKLNSILRSQGDRIIQINASEYNNTYWVYAFSTLTHKIVSFSQIRKEVKDHLGKDVIESEFTDSRTVMWEKTYASFDIYDEGFDVKIKVTSGKNTKKSAIKVMTMMKVASCSNSVICANFTSIKRTENWRERLQHTLTSAVEIATMAEKVIRIGIKRELTYEQGLMYIDTINLTIKDEDKIERVRSALKKRFETEYKKTHSIFSLSQALSYVGTYADPDRASERTLEILREKAYQVLSV